MCTLLCISACSHFTGQLPHTLRGWVHANDETGKERDIQRKGERELS